MKTALITGAFSDIGVEICHALAMQDYKLVCQYNANQKDAVLKDRGVDFVSIHADFSNHKSVTEFVDFVQKHTNTIDLILHCAAKHEKTSVNETDESIFNTVARVNLFSPIFITKSLRKKMEASENPTIIFISSTYAKQLGSLDNIYYASTKTALHTASRIFAREFSPVRSNVIMPGYVDTPVYRFGRNASAIEQNKRDSLNQRLVSPKEIAETVLFIIKNRSINGGVLAVDGGLQL